MVMVVGWWRYRDEKKTKRGKEKKIKYFYQTLKLALTWYSIKDVIFQKVKVKDLIFQKGKGKMSTDVKGKDFI